MGEKWPDEPEEPAPEERYGSPEHDLPSVPATPESPATTPESDADADPELLSAWWYSVVLANVAFGGVSVGLVLVGFRRMWLAGGAAVVLGLLAGLRLRTVIRTHRARTAADADADADADGSGDGEGTPAAERVEPPRHD